MIEYLKKAKVLWLKINKLAKKTNNIKIFAETKKIMILSIKTFF